MRELLGHRGLVAAPHLSEARQSRPDDEALPVRGQLPRELLEAERQAVVGLRNAGYINDESMYRVTRDLDLEDSRLEI